MITMMLRYKMSEFYQIYLNDRKICKKFESTAKLPDSTIFSSLLGITMQY